MLVYRISKEQYSSDLSGYGAKLYGGRWNLIGFPCLYTSQSRALALLEFTVNVGLDFMPPKLSFSVIEIPDDLIDNLKKEDLPQNWNAIPSSSSTQIFGSEKLKNAKLPIFRVPSVVIPNEFNYIINPMQMDSNNLKVVDVEDYLYDYRIKN